VTKIGTPPGWGLEHRASNPVSVENLTAIETSTIVKLRLYVPVGTKRTSKYILGPPAWRLGEGLTTPHRKKKVVMKCYTERRT
jgi:hypothetical protein